MDKLVSIIMCTYNETEIELRNAIQSALNQTYVHFELLIVLDNPKQEMIRTIVMEYAAKDQRIRVLKNEVNQGVAESSNQAWKAARGAYIAKLDADDIAMPDRLEIEVRELEKRNLDFIAASKRNVDENGKVVGIFVNNLDPKKMKKLLPYDNLVTQSTILMRKSVMDELGGYIDLPSCEDYDLWLRMLNKGYQMAILPEVLVDYKVRANSITRRDYYKQYLSDCFVRSMYRKYRGTGRVWSMEDYKVYIKKLNPTDKKRERYNQAYQKYYKGMEARKSGNKVSFVKNVGSGLFGDWRVMGVFVRKLVFHVRKKLIV